MPGKMADANTYKPKTRVQIKLTQRQLIDISQATGIPLNIVYRYADTILNESVRETIIKIIPKIHRYAPKATGQIRNSLESMLKDSDVRSYYGTGKILKMKLGTTVSYMKYIANMDENNLRHPKATERLRYKRKGKFGRKGQYRRNPGAWRFVRYYGGPRWVRLNDRMAQKNFFSLLIQHIKTELQKQIAYQINAVVPKGLRPQFNRRMVPRTP